MSFKKVNKQKKTRQCCSNKDLANTQDTNKDVFIHRMVLQNKAQRHTNTGLINNQGDVAKGECETLPQAKCQRLLQYRN